MEKHIYNDVSSHDLVFDLGNSYRIISLNCGFSETSSMWVGAFVGRGRNYQGWWPVLGKAGRWWAVVG